MPSLDSWAAGSGDQPGRFCRRLPRVRSERVPTHGLPEIRRNQERAPTEQNPEIPRGRQASNLADESARRLDIVMDGHRDGQDIRPLLGES